MASSVAKHKPLSSVIAELDDIHPQVMAEHEVLAGLADSSNFAKKAEILDQLKAYARRNHGRLDFEDSRALFRVLQQTLSDSDSTTRLHCFDFLSEIIPEFGPDLDDCMSEILPQLVSNFGNGQVSVKKSAIQTVHKYMKYSSDISGVFTAIIEHGLKNQDRKTATESLVALPILITQNLAREDLFPLTKSLVGRLEVSSNPEVSPAVISLERIRSVVGQSIFDRYLRNLSENQQRTYFMAVQNRSLHSSKDGDVFNLRKAKSAGHLSSNGVIDHGRSYDLQEGQSALDRGHTIAGSRTYGGKDFDFERIEYGFVPLSVVAKLQDQSNWRIRAQGIEELKTLMRQLGDISSVLPHLGSLFGLLLDFLDDVNFKITVTSLHILGLLVAKLGPNVRPFLKPLGAALTNKLGDNKIVIRQENMKVLMQLMQISSPKAVLAVLTSSLQHRNSRVREETVNVVIAALLTFPSSDFDLPELTRAIAPALVDSKRRVRQAALEAFAVIAQAMGPGRLQPVVSAVDAIELTSGGDGVMGAIQARLARRQLPRMNEDGLVEYAIPVPSSGTIRGQSTSPRGADVEWVLAGTSGTGSADVGSARSTPGLNDSLNNSGPSPRRYFSAGKNRLPWEGDSTQPSLDGADLMPPPVRASWGPTEIVNERQMKSGSQQRPAPLSATSHASGQKLTGSYAEKYLAKNMYRSNQGSDSHATKPPQVAGSLNSYAEMHRSKLKKDKTKGAGGSHSNSTAPSPAATGGSYALLYKRGTVGTKPKATSSAEPAVGETFAKESTFRGTQSATPTGFSLHSSFSPADEDAFASAQRKSLSSSWPDWPEPATSARPWGRLSPVSHEPTSDPDLESKRNDIRAPQTPVHVKPQLVRSASKTRGLRAPEALEQKKDGNLQGGYDLLDMNANRPAPLAPVGTTAMNTHPPRKDSFKLVHKQAATKRALKMYSVLSDNEDADARSPSPGDVQDGHPAEVESSIKQSSYAPVQSSPFDCKPRIARTPLVSRRLSADTSYPLKPLSPNSLKRAEAAAFGLGVTGLSRQANDKRSHSPMENGFEDGKSGRTSGLGSSVTNSEGQGSISDVTVVGQGLLKPGSDEGEEKQIEYETEESEDEEDEEIEEDEDDEEEEEEEEEEEYEEEEEDNESDQDEDIAQELQEKGDSNGSDEGEDEDLSSNLDDAIPDADDAKESSSDSSDSDAETKNVQVNQRDVTPRTMRKSLSKSTRERMERRRLEEEERAHQEKLKQEEFYKEQQRTKEAQKEEEKRLRDKIMKEQTELNRMVQKKEKERELERHKQRQLQEELQKQEKALRERLQKQQEELEEIEKEKQREREREKERLKEKMKQKQLKAQKEAQQRRDEQRQAEAAAEKLAAQQALAVTGTNSALKAGGSGKPPARLTPVKKTLVSSAHSEREAGYAQTESSPDSRRHHVASAGSSAQYWEVSLDDLEPFSNPDQAMKDAMKYFANSEDWEMKCEGLQYIRRLVKHHSDLVATQLHAVTLAVVSEVKNLRSQVSRSALCCLGDMFHCLGRQMDPELEVTTKILLLKTSETNAFIRDDAEKALSELVNSVTCTRSLVALVSGGASHRNVAIRKSTARFISILAERMGAGRLLSGAKDVTDKILPVAAQFATDGGSETRYYGRKILYILLEHPDFDKLLAKFVTTNVQKLREIVENLRTKGLGEPPQDLSSARQRKPPSGSSSRGGSSSTGKGQHVRSSTDPSLRGSLMVSPATSRESNRSGKSGSHERLVQGDDVIPNLINSMHSTVWKERLQAIDQFVSVVQLNPRSLGPKFTKVFDEFIPRLQDPNTKVNLHALQSLPKLMPALATQSAALIPPIVSALTANLASKNSNIFSSADVALNEFSENIDNSLLVQPYCTTAQYGNSRVKPIMIEKLAGLIPEVYSRKPQAIVRHVLSLLWNLIGATNTGSAGAGNSSIRSATTKLAKVLYSCMGATLMEQSSSQVPRTQDALQEMLAS